MSANAVKGEISSLIHRSASARWKAGKTKVREEIGHRRKQERSSRAKGQIHVVVYPVTTGVFGKEPFVIKEVKFGDGGE